MLNRSLVPVGPPAREVRRPPLTQEDYERLKEVMPTWRHLLLCKVLRATGLRISEALAVTPTHLEQSGPVGSVWVRRSKKRRPAWERVYFPHQLLVELRDYIKYEGIAPHEPLFQLTDRAVRYVFARAGMRALGYPVSPHQLRALYEKWLLDNGLHFMAAAKMVGHSDPRITYQHYYDLTERQRQDIQQRVPV